MRLGGNPSRVLDRRTGEETLCPSPTQPRESLVTAAPTTAVLNIVSLAPEGLKSWFVKPKLQSPSERGKHFTPPTKHVVLSAGYTITVIDELKQIVSCAASKLSFHSGRLAPLSLLTTHRSSLMNKS